MIKKIKNILLGTAFAAALVAAPVVAGSVVSAQINQTTINNCIAQGFDGSGAIGSGECTGEAAAGADADANFTDLIRLVINVISIIVGVVAVIMIIWGGLKYITSGGDSNKITSAKNTILYALIGLVIVALAQFIVRFVLAKANDVSIR